MQQSRFAKKILYPSEQDVSDAKIKGFEAFKILPRGMFDFEKNELSFRAEALIISLSKTHIAATKHLKSNFKKIIF